MSPNKKVPKFTASPNDWAEWSSQFQTETDRGVAIVAAAILDRLVAGLIESFILDDPDATLKLIGNPYSPLGSFASRTAAAFSLGLITKNEMADLDCIRDIRNKFAHLSSSCSFTDRSIARKVQALNIPKLIPDEIIDKSTYTLRKIFIDGVSMLYTFINSRTSNNHERRTTPRDFTLHLTKAITISRKKQP